MSWLIEAFLNEENKPIVLKNKPTNVDPDQNKKDRRKLENVLGGKEAADRFEKKYVMPQEGE